MKEKQHFFHIKLSTDELHALMLVLTEANQTDAVARLRTKIYSQVLRSDKDAA